MVLAHTYHDQPRLCIYVSEIVSIKHAIIFLCMQEFDLVHTGYYKVAKRYEFYVLVARTISNE